MPKQPIRVHIFNQTYTLLADGDEREIQELAHEIDELMTSIANRASSGDSTRIAVMACLHLADKLRSAETKLKSYEDQSGRIAEMLEAALLES
jgi:cell division protein ZapA